MEPIKPQEPILNNYSNKSIQFYKKDNRYILIFADVFFPSSKEDFVITDLYKDLQEADKKCEIHIFIDSPGGDCSTLEMLASEIRKFAQVITVCRGHAMSAGFLLWLIGDERYVTPGAALMFHEATHLGWLDIKTKEVKNWNEFSLKLNKQLLKEFQVEDFLTADELKLGETSEVWFTGQDMIDRKLALPYDNYNHRLTFGVVKDTDGNLWESDEQGIFTLYKKSKITKTLAELNGF